MFELTETSVRLINVNPRPEMHGDETKLAADLKLQVKCGNDVLNYFDRGLRELLYKRDEKPDLVDSIDAEALTALRFPKLDALRWDWVGTSYKLEVDWGMGGASNIELADVTVDKFLLEAQQGGTVVVTFRVVAHPDVDVLGPLCELMQRDITVWLTPPAPTTVQELFGEDRKEAA
jgi:hypothetical protein